jgi:hypothetical protein
VIVKNGTYVYTGAQDGYLVTIRRGGTSSAPITFKSENVRGAILDGNNLAHSIFSFSRNLSYVKIDGFKITKTRWFGINGGTGSSGNPHHLTITRNEIYNIGRWNYTGSYGICGFYTGVDSHDDLIDSNLFHDIGRTGTTEDNHDQILYLLGSNHVIRNNILCANQRFAGYPIGMWGP